MEAKLDQRSDKTKTLGLTRARNSFLPTFLQAPRRRRYGDPAVGPPKSRGKRKARVAKSRKVAPKAAAKIRPVIRKR